MQISSESTGDLLEMRVTGRLDNESSDQLTTAINDAVRMGSHSVSLDLSGVKYISSAGVGALVKAYKQLQSLRGFFGVVAISPEGADVIRLMGLTKMLLSDGPRVRGSTSIMADTVQPSFHVSDQAEMTYEVYDIRPGATMTCEVIGDPQPLSSDVFHARQCQPVVFPATTLGLGLGAFGRDFSDCASRFGEFLSVGGAAAQQPTSATGKPDFQRVIGEFVPSLHVLYGLKCAGDFARIVRFERVSPDRPLTLSAMADQFLKLADTDLAAIVILAESAGLIGAALRRSPAKASTAGSSRMSHPEIRRWLSFTPSHSYSHTLALAVGVVSRGAPTGRATSLAPLLRPLASNSDLYGHFHTAIFSYRPFKKRKLDLNDTVSALFETEDLQAVLHLLHDDRKISGGGESEFVNGACWLAPIADVTSARSPQEGN